MVLCIGLCGNLKRVLWYSTFSKLFITVNNSGSKCRTICLAYFMCNTASNVELISDMLGPTAWLWVNSIGDTSSKTTSSSPSVTSVDNINSGGTRTHFITSSLAALCGLPLQSLESGKKTSTEHLECLSFEPYLVIVPEASTRRWPRLLQALRVPAQVTPHQLALVLHSISAGN